MERRQLLPDKEPPLDGLTAALKIVTLQAVITGSGRKKPSAPRPPEADKNPAAAFANRFKVQTALESAAAARAKTADANSLLYLVKANQLASADPAKIKAPVLILFSPTDDVFYAPFRRPRRQPRSIAGPVEIAPLAGPNGHLNGVFGIAQAADRIASFLGR